MRASEILWVGCPWNQLQDHDLNILWSTVGLGLNPWTIVNINRPSTIFSRQVHNIIENYMYVVYIYIILYYSILISCNLTLFGTYFEADPSIMHPICHAPASPAPSRPVKGDPTRQPWMAMRKHHGFLDVHQNLTDLTISYWCLVGNGGNGMNFNSYY